MDRFLCLQAFVTIAETGSITRSARTLNTSKSVVSARLTALEHLVGERLVARTTRSMTLTEAGRQLCENYTPVVMQMANLHNARREATTLIGRIRVVAMIDVGQHEVAAALIDLQNAHAELQVELVLSNEIVDPRTSGFDIAFHFRKIGAPALIQEEIISFDCGVFASPDYLALRGTPLVPDDLRRHACLGYSFQAGVDEWNTSLWHFVKGDADVSIRVPLTSRSNSSSILRAAVLAGQGLAVLPIARTTADVDAGLLVRVLPTWRSPTLSLYAVHADKPHSANGIRAVIEAVRARCV